MGDEIQIEDTTIFGEHGDEIIVRVGIELIKADIIDDTTLEIVERGVENWEGEETPVIKHRKGISVWLYENLTQELGPYTPEEQDTAQEGSSIAEKGVKQLRETDKTIINLSTLEQVADRELRNRYEDIKVIEVDPADPRVEQDVSLGDDIFIDDAQGSQLQGEFRVVGKDVQRRSSGEGTILHCANRPRRLVERLSEIERDRDTLNAHMQGATNFNSVSFGDNCDEDNPLRNSFYVPEDVVQVNKFDLTFKRESFRGYVRNQAHTHEFESFESSDTGEWTNSGILVLNDSVEGISDPEVFVDTPESPTGQDAGVNITVTIFNQDTEESQSYDVELVNDSTDDVLASESFTLGTNSIQTFNYTRDETVVSAGDTIRLDVEGDIRTNDFYNSYIHLDVSGKSSHDHEGTVLEDGGEPVYGIFEPDTEPDIDVEVVVDGTTVTTVEDVSVGDEIDTPISMVQDLNEPIAGNYHTVELIPIETDGGENGRARIRSDVVQKVFIESTL